MWHHYTLFNFKIGCDFIAYLFVDPPWCKWPYNMRVVYGITAKRTYFSVTRSEARNLPWMTSHLISKSHCFFFYSFFYLFSFISILYLLLYYYCFVLFYFLIYQPFNYHIISFHIFAGVVEQKLRLGTTSKECEWKAHPDDIWKSMQGPYYRLILLPLFVSLKEWRTDWLALQYT